MNQTTRVRKVSRRQRGVALLIALFALLLLSCIGLGMMYSADTETSINANYKDKEAAIYAANAGLEEVKDRLLLAGYGDITAPAGLPSLSAANITYVLNPGASESVSDVKPWDYTNSYADTELCQNNVLGLTRNLGTPCTGATSLPTVNTWYTTINNTGHWSTQLNSTPLNYKWVRLQLKANNTTPFAVNGNASDGTEVCWDGLHQIPLPAGYGTNCRPVGGVTLFLQNGGSGYTSTPTVTISAPPAGGTQAVYTPIMANVSGQVTQITVNNPGSGYDPLNPPLVTIAPPASGTTATATANVIASGGSLSGVTSVTPNNGCYTANPLSPIAVPGGVTAGYFQVQLTSSACIASIDFPNKGKKCSGNLTVTGGTSSATVAITYAANGVVSSWSITDPGAGYTSTPAATDFSGVSCTGGGSSTPTISVSMGHQVLATGATVSNSGSGYASSSYSVTIPGNSSGTSASAVIAASASNPNAGQISGFTVTNPGSGYTVTPPLVVVAPPASGVTATGTANTSATQVVSGFTQVNSGSGYTGSPTVTISAPGGSGTTATALAQVASGPYYSPVILLTALGQTRTGGRAMTQMEVAYRVKALTLPGALTLAGPTPSYGSPNSNNFYISGIDHPNGWDGTGSSNPPGCSGAATASHPAIGVYDDPNNPTSPSSVDTLLDPGVLQPDGTHYPGVNGAPDIQNVYGALGLTTPSDFNDLVTQVAQPPANIIPTGTLSLGTAANPAKNVVYGDLTLSGNTNGYGYLVVTGVLTFTGNFTWNGIVMVIGKGDIEFGGGGGGTINGSVIIAKTVDDSGNPLTTLGTPILNWSGGGGNGIYYDHCWSDGLLNSLPLTFPDTPDALKILSVRTMPY
ncbi:MAG TPA: hypothetical protein VFU76_02685 [Terriglobales bacterium]|nr:hypothetical protein [Terriglobales bacterium]